MLNELEKVARVTGDLLGSLGHRAARLYIEDRVPLNTSIYKMAQEHSLNSEHVKRVCEKANTAVDGALFDAFQKVARHQTGDGKIFYPKFPAAEPKVVLAALQRVEKTASVSVHLDDYDKAPPVNLTLAYNANLESEFDKIASVKDPVTARPGVALEKLEFLREEVLLNKAASELNIDKSSDDCYQHIKQQVMRGSDLKDLYKAALRRHSNEEDKHRVTDLFQLAAQKLVDEGLVITRDRQAVKLAYAPLSKEQMKELFAGNFETPAGAGRVQVLNGSYVNDDHPMFSELDILVKQYDEADRYDKALTVIDDKIKYVKRKIRGESIGGA
jgi:hypothetical protein